MTRSSWLIVAYAASLLFTSCSVFNAAEGRRDRLVADIAARQKQLSSIAQPDNRDVSKVLDVESTQLKVLRDKAYDVDTNLASARDDLVEYARQVRDLAKRTQKDLAALRRLDALLGKIDAAIARLDNESQTRKLSKAEAQTRTALKQLRSAGIRGRPGTLDAVADTVETALGKALAPAEAQNPDKLAQERLRTKLKGLQARAKGLRDWGRSDRAKDIEKVQQEVDALLGEVPDPDNQTLTATARVAKEGSAKGLETRVARLERDFHLIQAPWFRAHAGSITITPYALKATGGQPQFQLEKTSSSGAFYAELDFLHRNAWLHPDDRYTPNYDLNAFERALIPEDLELRLRFVDDAQINDATAAATGDFQFEGSSGWSLVDFDLYDSDPTSTDPKRKIHSGGSLNIELMGGVTTDRDRIDSYNYIQAGLGSAWSFPIQLSNNTYRMATVFAGIYCGVHEFPRIDANDTVFTTSPRPHFNHLGALGGRIDFTIPITERIEFITGVRYFSPLRKDNLPDDWSLFVGASLPIGRLVRGLIGDP